MSTPRHTWLMRVTPAPRGHTTNLARMDGTLRCRRPVIFRHAFQFVQLSLKLIDWIVSILKVFHMIMSQRAQEELIWNRLHNSIMLIIMRYLGWRPMLFRGSVIGLGQ
jgi:hypothetical protein